MAKEDLLEKFKRENDSALEAGIIALDEDEKNVIYPFLNKKYRLSDPEELVRASAYASLILDFGASSRGMSAITPRKAGEPYDFQVFTDDKGDDLKKRIQNLYEKGREKDPEVFKEHIRLSNSELQTVVGYLAGTNLGKTDLDSKGRAFETFLTGFFRGEFGQYFTPRNIVKFIVDALPIQNEDTVLDTSSTEG